MIHIGMQDKDYWLSIMQSKVNLRELEKYQKKQSTRVHLVFLEELVKMVNESSGEIIIHVELGEECDSDEGKESVQP